jgi:hypothetical protein
MFRSCVASCGLLAALSLAPGPARAQEGLIFSGGFFDSLYAAVDMDYLRIEHPELRFHIVDRRLTALVIPDLQADEPYILKCDRRSTRLVKVPLTKEDVDRLRGFARDGIYQALQGFRAAPQDPQRIADLQRRVKDLPAEKRVQAERFIGSQVADMDVSKNHPLASYVGSYRDHVERRTIDSLKHPDTSKDLKDGVPHAYGTQTINHGDLSRAKDIQVVTINGRYFQKAWVDGALVVVPQTGSSQPSPDAWKKLKVAPEIQNQAKPNTQVQQGKHQKKQ